MRPTIPYISCQYPKVYVQGDTETWTDGLGLT